MCAMPMRAPSARNATTVVPVPRSWGSSDASVVSRSAASLERRAECSGEVDVGQIGEVGGEPRLELQNGLDRDRARDLAVSVAAHAVGDDEQARACRRRVLVHRPPAADVRILPLTAASVTWVHPLILRGQPRRPAVGDAGTYRVRAARDELPRASRQYGARSHARDGNLPGRYAPVRTVPRDRSGLRSSAG